MFLQHLKIDSSEVSSFALLPGDPQRVDIIGKFLDDFRILNQNREFRTGIGSYKGIKITVTSTGIGCPSTAIVTEELIAAGTRVLIRVGTCGGAWRKDIKLGSLIIPTASIRDEGTTLEYIPQGFPAVPDFNVLSCLKQAAEKLNALAYTGINRCHDSFYGTQKSITKWGDYLTDNNWVNQDTPILSSEMETSALFIIGALRNIQTGAILAVNANPEPLKERILGRTKPVITEVDSTTSNILNSQTAQVALEAIYLLNNNNNE